MTCNSNSRAGSRDHAADRARTIRDPATFSRAGLTQPHPSRGGLAKAPAVDARLDALPQVFFMPGRHGSGEHRQMESGIGRYPCTGNYGGTPSRLP